MTFRSVAIDGPSGAGKSTLSRAVAHRIGFLYVDTGALYRVVGLHYLRSGVPEPDALRLDGLTVGMRHIDGEQRVFLNGEDVSADIRRHEVSGAASDCSARPGVRAFLLEQQRALARSHDVIMDGRDIGTVVLPDADLKIYLTATVEDRALRRYLELRERGQEPELAALTEDIRRRDENDTRRAVAPLRRADDAILLDTTGNSFAQSLALLEHTVRTALGL